MLIVDGENYMTRCSTYSKSFVPRLTSEARRRRGQKRELTALNIKFLRSIGFGYRRGRNVSRKQTHGTT